MPFREIWTICLMEKTHVVAIANDGSGALSRPTIAQVHVVETILATRNDNFDNCELAKDH